MSLKKKPYPTHITQQIIQSFPHHSNETDRFIEVSFKVYNEQLRLKSQCHTLES